MRPFTEIDEIVALICGNRSGIAAGQIFFDQFQLKGLFFEYFFRFLLADYFFLESFIPAHDFFHFLFYSGQVVRRKGILQIKIVVKAVFNGRPHAELCSGV